MSIECSQIKIPLDFCDALTQLCQLWICSLKQQSSAKSKRHIFPLSYSAIYPSRLFCWEWLCFGDIDSKLCFQSNIMDLICPFAVLLKAPINYIGKTGQQCLSPDIRTRLFKMIHRSWCSLLSWNSRGAMCFLVLAVCLTFICEYTSV